MQPGSDTDSPLQREAIKRAISTNQSSSGGDALLASKQLRSTKSQQAGWRCCMHGLTRK